MKNTAKKYQSLKVGLFFLELLITFGYLLFFQFIGLSHFLKFYMAVCFKSVKLIIAGYIFIFGIIYYITILPLKFYRGFLLEHKFLLSNQTLLGWVSDEAKEIVISSIIFFILIEIFYLVLRISENFWWIWMSIIWLLFSLFFARIFPTLILPLFYKYKDIDSPDLKASLIDLAKRNGVDVLDVFQIDFSSRTKKANAALIGLGRSKRIILADNLIANYNKGEINAVLAHEIGHYKYRHMWKLIIFNVGVTLLSFYLIFISASYITRLLGISKIYDIEAFPMIVLILSLFGFIAMPLVNGYSRRLEREADRFSLFNTHDKESFVSCMKKLAEQNLSDCSPSKFIEFLFYDHPPILKRIKFAEESFK